MHIAVVEDEEKLAALLQEGLQQEGYQVSLFFDGLSAQQALEKHPTLYDLMVLDLMLPVKSGFEVCQGLRNSGITLPILILTARDTVEDKVTVLDSGADDFVTKPFVFEELLARIRAIARRVQAVETPQLTIANIILDRSTRITKQDGVVVPLTFTEFELLWYLLEHRPAARSRDEIFAHLWPRADIGMSNIIDVHIRNIRKKLHDDHQEVIRTVRGLGYAAAA